MTDENKKLNQAIDEALNHLIFFCEKMIEHKEKKIDDKKLSYYGIRCQEHSFHLGEIDAYNHVMWELKQNLSENVLKEILSPCGCEEREN